MRKGAVFVALLLFAFACRSKQQDIIPLDSMKVVIFDLLRMDQYFVVMQIKDTTLRRSKENIRLYDEVFALHHITRGRFDSSYKYYESHPSLFKQLVDSLDTHALREKNKIPLNHGQAVKK